MLKCISSWISFSKIFEMQNIWYFRELSSSWRRKLEAYFGFVYSREKWVQERGVSIKQKKGNLVSMKNVDNTDLNMPIKLVGKWIGWRGKTVKPLLRNIYHKVLIYGKTALQNVLVFLNKQIWTLVFRIGL